MSLRRRQERIIDDSSMIHPNVPRRESPSDPSMLFYRTFLLEWAKYPFDLIGSPIGTEDVCVCVRVVIQFTAYR
jgi:hypothetical protein